MSESARITWYDFKEDVLVVQMNTSNNKLAYYRQFLGTRDSMSLVTNLISAKVKKEIDWVIVNLYFKLPTNNINLFILNECFLEKIDKAFNANALFSTL